MFLFLLLLLLLLLLLVAIGVTIAGFRIANTIIIMPSEFASMAKGVADWTGKFGGGTTSGGAAVSEKEG